MRYKQEQSPLNWYISSTALRKEQSQLRCGRESAHPFKTMSITIRVGTVYQPPIMQITERRDVVGYKFSYTSSALKDAFMQGSHMEIVFIDSEQNAKVQITISSLIVSHQQALIAISTGMLLNQGILLRYYAAKMLRIRLLEKSFICQLMDLPE